MSLQSIGDYLQKNRGGSLERIYISSKITQYLKRVYKTDVRVVVSSERVSIHCPNSSAATALNLKRATLMKEVARISRRRDLKLTIKVKPS